MSYTNHTTNYNLPQYIGTDKPTYLTDFNGAMSAIDAQMKLNADSASTAGTNATTANTNIGTLSNLTTEAKTNLVSAINEVDSHADTAQSTANSANETAGSALSSATTANNDITALKSYLSLSSVTNYTTSSFSIVSGGGTFAAPSQSFTVARNSEGTLCKIYGAIQISGATQGQNVKIKLNADTGLKPTEAFTVVGTGFGDGVNGITNLNIKFNTDGTIEFDTYVGADNVVLRPMACLIFVQDFGDQPE